MNLFKEFLLVTQALEVAGVVYAVVGGLALAYHAQPRFTRDIDLLTTPDQIDAINKTLSGLSYFESAAPWQFSNTNITLHRFMKPEPESEDFYIIDILCGSDTRTEDILANALIDKAGEATVRVARKEDLIYLKMLRNSAQDKADIERLQDDTTGKND